MSRVLYIDVLLVFFLINSFYFYYPINSSMVAGCLVVFLGFIFKPGFVNDCRVILFSKYIFHLILFIFLLAVLCLFLIVFHGTYDFSYLSNYFSQLLQVVFTVLVLSYIFNGKEFSGYSYISYVSLLIVYAFVAQSVIEFLAFLFPPVTALVHLTYTEDQLAAVWSEYYNYARGLALSGSAGWSLTVGFGVTFLIYTKEFLVTNTISFKSTLLLLILILGTFFAGRTGFLGLIIGVLYFLVSKNGILNKLKIILKGVVFVFSIIFFVYFSFPNIIDEVVERVFPFVFEFIYQKEQTGSFETSSTNTLIEMWKVSIDEKTYIYGSGYFTDPDTGGYFMKTDVGYLRNLLFGGIGWVVIVAFYNLYMIFAQYFFSEIKDRKEILFMLFMLFYTLMLDLKAMAMGFNKYLFTMILIYSIAMLYDSKKKVLDELY